MTKLRVGNSDSNLPHANDIERQMSRRGAVEDADIAHVKSLNWKVAGLLQIGDIVGTGILALGSAVALVGYIPAIIFMLTFLPLNIYAGYILQEAFLIFPAGTSLPKMSEYAINRKWFTIIVKILYYSFMVGVLGQYVQVLASSLESILVYVKICNWTFVLISVFILLPFIQFRTLNESSALQFINTVSITLVVVISVLYMLIHMDQRTGTTVLFNTSATWQDVFSSLSKFVFAFNGNMVFLEFLAEMDQPETFHKAFYISAPYQLFMYSLAAFTQYAYTGDSQSNGALIFKAIPQDNPLYGICAFLLFIHMICAYLIKGTILARAIHVRVFRSTVNDTSCKGSTHWFAITFALAFFSFLISSAIPNFGALMDLLASFQVAPLGFIIPPLLLIFSRRYAELPTSVFEYIVLVSVILFGSLLTGVGSAQSIIGLSQSFGDQPPFYCST